MKIQFANLTSKIIIFFPVDCIEHATAYIGGDITNYISDINIETCSEKCDENEQCQIWLYRLSNRRCFLKDNSALPRADEDAVSGQRNCRSGLIGGGLKNGIYVQYNQIQ